MLVRIVARKQTLVQKAFAVPDPSQISLAICAFFCSAQRAPSLIPTETTSSVNVLFKSGTKRMPSKGISIVPLTEERESALYDSHEARSFCTFSPQSLHLFMARERRSSINRHLPSRELPALRLYLT